MNKYKETHDTWNEIADLYAEKFMSLDLYNDTYQAFLNLLKEEDGRVLDVGCGPGNVSKYLSSRNPNLSITGIDVSENMLDLARKYNPSADFKLMDSRDVSGLDVEFNGIVSAFCIPYLDKADCAAFISDCRNLLNGSGAFYLSFVDGKYENSGFKEGSGGQRAFFYYHELGFILDELKKNLFHVKKKFFKNYMRPDGSEEIHTIVLAMR